MDPRLAAARIVRRADILDTPHVIDFGPPPRSPFAVFHSDKEGEGGELAELTLEAIRSFKAAEAEPERVQHGPKLYEEPEEAIRDVHAQYLLLLDAWDGLVELARRNPTAGSRFVRSVEAYQPLVRDQGMGDDFARWLEAAAEVFDVQIVWESDDPMAGIEEIEDMTDPALDNGIVDMLSERVGEGQ